jgi:DNA adenine methylase
MNTVLKYPGSKWSMTDWIISMFPEDYEKMTYCEPFFGSGAVFFNKKRSVIETINDLDGNIVNLFKVIRDNTDELTRMIELTPWSREEYRESYEMSGESLEDARRFLVRMWMAIGSKSSDSTGWRHWIASNYGWAESWVTRLPENISLTASRLRHIKGHVVQIENHDAIKLIKRYNKPNVLIYVDPPYVRSTRSSRIYKYEYTDQKHIELLEAIVNHKGKVLISGYDCELYNNMLPRWNKSSLPVKAEGGRDAIETIWMNYKPNKQISLFEMSESS